MKANAQNYVFFRVTEQRKKREINKPRQRQHKNYRAMKNEFDEGSKTEIRSQN